MFHGSLQTLMEGRDISAHVANEINSDSDDMVTLGCKEMYKFQVPPGTYCDAPSLLETIMLVQ